MQMSNSVLVYVCYLSPWRKEKVLSLLGDVATARIGTRVVTKYENPQAIFFYFQTNANIRIESVLQLYPLTLPTDEYSSKISFLTCLCILEDLNANGNFELCLENFRLIPRQALTLLDHWQVLSDT